MWAKLSETKAGDFLTPDAGFTCMKSGDRKPVQKDARGLYVECDEGRHYLDGQADDGESMVGLKVAPALSATDRETRLRDALEQLVGWVEECGSSHEGREFALTEARAALKGFAVVPSGDR